MASFRAVKSLVVGFRPSRFVVESRVGTSGGSSGGGGSSPVVLRWGSTGVRPFLEGSLSRPGLLVAVVLRPALSSI